MPHLDSPARRRWQLRLLVVACAMAFAIASLAPPAGAPNAAAAASPDLVPVTPVRVWDSRPGQPRGSAGMPARALSNGQTAVVSMRSIPGVPRNAKAVVLNVTSTDTVGSGYIRSWPCGSRPPGTSSLNIAAGEATANQVVVAIDHTGRACFSATTPTHVVIDANAYVARSAVLSVFSPWRAIDSRRTAAGAVPAGGVRKVQIGGRNGLPARAGTALVNITSTAAAAGGYLAAYPCSATPPVASALNFAAGETRANAGWVRLDASGAFCIASSVRSHIVVDVSGHSGLTTPGVAPAGPHRVVDTRRSWGIAERLQPDQTARFGIAGLSDAPQSYQGAVLLNVAVTGQAGEGHITMWPCSRPMPVASSVNFAAGPVRSNAVVMAPGGDGRICLRSSAGTHVVVDIYGFVNPPGRTYTYRPPVMPALQDGMTAAEITALRASNAARAVGRQCGSYGYFPPAPALRAHRLLASAAGAHASDMAWRDYFEHTGADGSQVGQRIDRTGLRWSRAGENLVAGYAQPQAAVNALLASPSHCRTLMDPKLTHIGIGYASNPSSKYRHYWAQVLATPR